MNDLSTLSLTAKQLNQEIEQLNRDAWNVQYGDPVRSHALAARARLLAKGVQDERGEHYARLSLACYQMRHGDVQQAAHEFHELKQWFAQHNERLGLLRACFGIAAVLGRQGRVQAAFDELGGLEPESEPVSLIDRCVLLNSMGIACIGLGRLDDGIAHYYRALLQARQSGSDDHLALVLSNLGDTQHCLGNYEDAISFLSEAFNVVARSGRVALNPLVAGNLAMCQLALGDHQAAYAVIEPFLNLAQGTVRAGRAEAAFFQAIAAHTYYAQGEWVAARAALARASQAASASGDRYVQVHCGWVQGLLAISDGQPETALANLKVAFELLTDRPEPFYGVRLPLEMAHVCAALGRWQEAYQYLSLHQERYAQTMRTATSARTQLARLRAELELAEHERDRARSMQANAEAARAELEQLNLALSQKVVEVQNLQHLLSEQVIRDPLTELYNRRYLQDALGNQIRLAERRYSSLSVVLIDLDHFKLVNDRFGHLFGDKVLLSLASLLRDKIRGSDFACRYGGEEFCLVLSDIGEDLAKARVEALLEQWRQVVVELDGVRLSEMAFSAGIAEYPRHGRTSEFLLASADVALYKAKEQGRDQVILAD